MEPIEHNDSSPGLGLNDILFILFRHKWKISLCALLGVAAALLAYLHGARNYESSAKLLVHYVADRTIDPVDPQLKTAATQADTVINSEVEILTSLDLATQVVEAVGLEKLSPSSHGDGDAVDAVRNLARDIKVVTLKGSNVITISYRNPDPELARTVLEQFVERYFDKHLEAHRSLGAFQFVSNQAGKIREQLRQTDDQLEALKKSAGILSLPESTTTVNARIAKCGQELLLAEAELAAQQASLKEVEASIGDSETGLAPIPTHETEPLSDRDVQSYEFQGEQLAQLRKAEMELLAKYAPQSKSVRTIQRQIEDLSGERHQLERKHPALLAIIPKNASNQSAQTAILPERSKLAGAEAKVNSLKTQLKAAEESAGELAQVGPKITELEHKKEAEEANLKLLESSLDKASVTETLDPTKMPNINIIQKPSFGMKLSGEAKKLVLGLAGGGLALGIGLALLIELVLNRSVQRPQELETRLKVPQLIAIPHYAEHSRLQLRAGGSNRIDAENAALQSTVCDDVSPWSLSPFFRPFAEEIRDRLLLWFKLKNLSHKPKLVGIAGLAGQEGASTIAGSLAVALSETGDGKVLLVDMHSGHAEANPLFDGKPACGLAEALKANGHLPSVANNLYLASGVSDRGATTQLAGRRFYGLVPDLQASHFDYIIFDLPPVNLGSATLAIAGCLDKLLLVVEAEKSDRDEIKRAYLDLVDAKAEVSAILNKTRSSGPKWLNS